MSVYLSEILATYWPEASWSMLDEDYGQLNWNSDDIPKPTLEEVNQKITEHSSIKAFSILRRERDRLLTESDWTQMPDVPEVPESPEKSVVSKTSSCVSWLGTKTTLSSGSIGFSPNP